MVPCSGAGSCAFKGSGKGDYSDIQGMLSSMHQDNGQDSVKVKNDLC